MVIGVGKVYNDFMKLKVFAEALAAFDPGLSRPGKDSVLDDITHSNNAACWYPARQLSKLQCA